MRAVVIQIATFVRIVAQIEIRQGDWENLLLGAKQHIEPRFAAISCVAMNDSALGRFIEGGNQAPNLFGVGLGGAASFLLE